MADDHDHHHHHDGHRDPPSFPIQTGPSIVGFLIFFLAYYLSHHSPFTYVEVDTHELAARSARGEPVTWSSFDRRFSQRPKAFLQPSNKGEVLEILRRARDENQTVKVVGSGHSWNPLGLTPSYMVNLDKLNRVLEIDAEKRRVRVEAGIRIRDLSAALAAHDPPLALKNTGVLNRQSLAGALATGTHGTGVNFPIMSEQLRAMELVTAAGEIVRATKEDPDPALREVFEASTIHLGALGIVTELELEVVEAFSVFKRTRFLSLEEVLAQLPHIAQASDHVLCWWVPYTETVQLLETNRTAANGVCAEGERQPTAAVSSSGLAALVGPWLRPLRPLLGKMQLRAFSAAGWLSSLLPLSTVPFTNKWLVAPALHAFAWGGEAGVFVPEGYKGICLDDHPDQYREAEYFLPASRFPQAFAQFRALLEEHRATLGANFVVQLRMTARDDLWLSPFRGEEDWYVSVATLVKGFDADPYFRRAEAEVWLPHDGKPHWGKLHYLGHNELGRLYGEGFERFLAVRRRLDPTDMFLNAYLRDLFLPRASK